MNWLLARHARGSFVLRIEDTDVARSDAGHESALIEDLRWLGLEWDEGPDIGGPRGPYRQSERLPMYRAAAERLLSEGPAYPCYCTDEELAERRTRALAEGRAPRYDGTCRNLSDAARRAREAEGRRGAVRFHVSGDEVRFQDLVRGEIRFGGGAVGDFIILRSDGYPTYNFACVLDDAAMGITHVVRGEDHLSNTVRQQLLYAALGAPPPLFAHVSLILGPDREKLSKREGSSSTAELRRLGYLPEALVNYLALLGWSPEDGREKMSPAELVERFSLDRVNRAAAIFDVAKLTWLNGLYIRERSAEDLYPLAAPYLDAAGVRDRDRGIAMLRAVQSEIERLSDLPPALGPLTHGARSDEAREILSGPRTAELLGAVTRGVAGLPEWSGPAFRAAIVAAGTSLGIRGRDLFLPVRAALTGRAHGPELPLVAEALGRDTVIERLEQAVAGGT